MTAALATVLALSATLVGAPPSAHAAHPDALRAVSEQPPGATTLRISTFNVLGAGHTDSGKRPGWKPGKKRMSYAVRLIENNGLDVIGFQELQPPQFKRFDKLLGDRYGIFPGDQMTEAAMHNSITWRLADWTLVSAQTVQIPYFKGNLIRMPYVLLEHNRTGQRAYFYNAHHPANSRGNAEKWRRQGMRIEIDLVNRLRAESPGVPVFVTGDMNEREDYFCPVLAKTELLASNGGYHVDGVCRLPEPARVDWIFATSDVSFTSHTSLRNKLVKKTTDHWLIFGDASIQPKPLQQLPVRRVLVIDVAGLRSSALRNAGTAGAPHLHRMMARGSATLNARTTYEETAGLPNVVSMVTGRRVRADAGGHGITADRDLGQVVRGAGGYVASVFDLVHDRGRGTALFSSDPAMRVLQRTWGPTHGAPDRYGVDNGRNKIDQTVIARDDRQLTDRLVRQLGRSPKAFTFVQLTTLRDQGRRTGWGSPPYREALTRVDRMVNRILRAVGDDTIVLLTAGSGGTKKSQRAATRPTNFTVPFIAWGPGVVPGADLYDLNPAYRDPRRARVPYSAVQPIRNAMVANLATAFLGLPKVPGSAIGARQDVNLVVSGD